MFQGCRLLKGCRNLPAWHCVAGCLSGVKTYLVGTVLQGCMLFKWCWNLPAGHCFASCRLFKWCPNLPAMHRVAGVQAVLAMWEPSSRALWCRGAGCANSVRTTSHACRLFKWCRNLPALHCVAGVQAVQVVLETTCRAWYCRGAVCLSSVGTYLQGTVEQTCRLFKQCQNLPPMHCGPGVQAV